MSLDLSPFFCYYYEVKETGTMRNRFHIDNGLLLIRSGITKVLLDLLSGVFGYFFCNHNKNHT